MKRGGTSLNRRRNMANLMIYLSVALGLVLIVQLQSLVPTWLFLTVIGGWVAYLVVAILTASGSRFAYPLALALAVLTLFVSLPQPEHYALVGAGLNLASLTFITGSALQLLVIITVTRILLLNRSTLKRNTTEDRR